MNKAILVQTQYLENYGRHSEDGKHESGNAHWKFKGGDEWLVFGTTNPANAYALVAALVIVNSLYSKEFPIGWEEVDADYQTDFEKSQMEHEGVISHKARRIHIDKKETWKKGDYDYEGSIEKTCALFRG